MKKSLLIHPEKEHIHRDVEKGKQAVDNTSNSVMIGFRSSVVIGFRSLILFIMIRLVVPIIVVIDFNWYEWNLGSIKSFKPSLLCVQGSKLFFLWAAVALALVTTAKSAWFSDPSYGGRLHQWTDVRLTALTRRHVAKLTDFGGVGDGVTYNTAAFAAAVANLSKVATDGGAMLVVPAGRWLTGPFNLTSHFTLFLESDAVILASQNLEDFPIIAPLPSYGRGRDLPGGRYANVIMGYNLTDVAITGNNGTINGQGQVWWEKYRAKELQHTRGYLVEFMFSNGVLVSNITLMDSPSWNLHPVYCSDVVVSGITITVSSLTSPNTDGINPDSSTNVRILDSYVISGDDCIAIKSGWDQYGIAFNMPSKQIYIKNFTCISPTSATIAIGSEMSGGVEDVHAEDITAINTESAVRIKTGIGRGGYVKQIFAKKMSLHNMKYIFWMTGAYGQHPDDNFDPNAIPVVENINYGDVTAKNVTMVGKLEGLEQSPFTGICLSNVTAEIFVIEKKPIWNCTFVEGVSTGMSPGACAPLKDMGADASTCVP
ncbi:hypothetical protein Cni_G08854 [Canna indica]|uniref:Polygalacturonase n=1 Tax=Canna indica TaxID=4628 RepID=A0AAQ3Q618_9LILI|nr:hypothetical protein Cni_G08854 [Canna indica]